MQQITRASSVTENTTLDRFLGAEARIISRDFLKINLFIEGDILCLDNATLNAADEQGRLFLYPVADGEYHLHLVCPLQANHGINRNFLWLRFLPGFFNQFSGDLLLNNTPFRFDQTTEQDFAVCGQIAALAIALGQTNSISEFLRSLHQSELAAQILRRAIENIMVSFTVCPVPACRFLAHETEREKIFEARRIIELTIDQPLTIKELSRKVAMNECYLKKGFKTLTGKTINEYQQHLRITKAKELLQQQGQTVSEVADMLGYSSISHFSAAFKKATGLKPCELLG